MSTFKVSCFRSLVLLTLLSCTSTILAQNSTPTTHPSSNPTASSTYNVFSAIASSSPPDSNDPGGSPSDNPAGENPNTAGASGKSQTAITLNTGDQIAIGVVVGLVALLGISSAILFYLAKKRQWEVRASIRRSARRVTTAFRAKTPTKPNFSRRDRGGAVRIDPPPVPALSKNRDKSKRSGGILKEGKARPERIDTGSMDRDVEKGLGKGFGTHTKIEAGPRFSPPPPPPPKGPKSSFEMDSPLTGNRAGAGNGKTGRASWMKMFGRK